MEKIKKYFLKERFLQSSKAFLLLEALICLLLFCFALLLSTHLLSLPKTLKPLQSQTLIPQSSQSVILKSGELMFEAKRSVYERDGGKIFVLEDFR